MLMAGKVVISGVGLIGGSFALACKARLGRDVKFVGMGRSRATLEQAKQLGIIDEIGSDWASALQGADFVMLGMPVGQMPAAMEALVPHLEPQTLVTDGGSTKQDVVAAARAAFGNKIAQFIPGHPIAGAEKSGAAAARADLYQGKRVVLTPLAENTPEAVRTVRAVWEFCGAKVSELTPEAHDKTFAAVSHLPHLLAFALVDEFAKRPNAAELFANAGGGFRDFTRIASSHPEMWRDISVANRAALIVEVDQYINALLQARVLLASADAAGLETLFASARNARNAWLEQLEK
ncbi:MAG TPA: prephenate dehydrogenase/arogenate dehydrogenase family protein [Rhodocyclaceae bacterium]|nr:prephenate dehydrogenase/arogenate dehydrogenase family protein [Rhodocyclaceae bacterium]